MSRKTFHAAMSTTLGAIMFTPAGVLGYVVNWHSFGSFGYRTGAPVWWELWMGLAFAVVAVVAWRRVFASFKHA